MRKTIKKTILLSASVILSACSRDMLPVLGPQAGDTDAASAKIINTPADASSSSILVCLDEESAAAATSEKLRKSELNTPNNLLKKLI